MKILHVVEASGAGVGRHVLDLADGLLDREHEVHLAYSPRREGRFFHERLVALDDIQTLTVDLHREPHPSDLVGVQVVREALRERGPFDLIHGHSSKGGAVARLAAATAGVPAIYTPHAVRTLDPTISGLARYAVTFAERILACVEGLVIAVSPVEKHHLARIGIPPRRLRMVPNCVRPAPLPTRPAARRALGLPQEAKVVGFVGRLASQKAPDVLLSAFFRVARAHPDAVLAVIGDGPLRPALCRATEQLGLEDQVRWLGERDGQRSMPAFDVLAQPSRYEGLPHVLLEALLAGLPIVATEEASAGLVVEPGVNGLVVPVDDPDAMADALIHLLAHEESRDSYGQASKFRAARFSHERMVEDTLRIYSEVLHDGGEP